MTHSYNSTTLASVMNHDAYGNEVPVDYWDKLALARGYVCGNIAARDTLWEDWVEPPELAVLPTCGAGRPCYCRKK
jgi:hypothetical protein